MSTYTQTLNLPRQTSFVSVSRPVALALFFTLSYWLAVALRYDFAITEDAWHLFAATLPWVVGIKLIAAYLLQGAHSWVRYVSFHDLVQLARTSVIASFTIVLVDQLALPHVRLRYSIVFLDFATTILLVGGFRAAGRFSQEHFWPLLNMHVLKRDGYKRVLLVGASRNGVVLANQIHFHPTLKYKISGFLDDDHELGSRPGGIKVLGGLRDVGNVAAACGVKDVLAVAGTLTGPRMRQLMGECKKAGVALKVITNVHDLVNDRYVVGPQGLQFRDVDINDLLRREPIALDSDAIAVFLEGKVVAVTGAGGSIGSEICRQVLRFKPKSLVLIDQTESNLFNIDREVGAMPGAPPVHAFIADVADRDRLRHIFAAHRPQVMFHAAGYKHVSMMENNPSEAVKNNVFGTKTAANIAQEFGLESFVFISTDKAVNPSSVMGLTKQIAERYVNALSFGSPTRFVVVRFGNVLGSVGSVVPIFQQQIQAGGPITVTHPEMRRYFMTIPEASQLVLQAGATAETGQIVELDMGEPVRIVDLAHDMIRLSGLSPDSIEVVFTGSRPGEKLFEELYCADEETVPTMHPKIRIASQRSVSMEEMTAALQELDVLILEPDSTIVVHRLRERFVQSGSKGRRTGLGLRSQASVPRAMPA